MARIPDYIVKNWNRGIINRIEDSSTPKGAASDSLNWMTEGDRISLRRGQAPLGTALSGSGRVTGLKVGRKLDDDATEVVLATYGRKVRWYTEAAADFAEINTADLFPAAADGEDISIDVYNSLAGAFFYFSSPNSGMYKIATANPADVTDLKQSAFRGKIRIKSGRMYLWDRKDQYGGSDKTGLFRSWIDKDELADYPIVTGEDVGTGNGVLTNFTGTLAMRTASTKRTCMFVRIAAPIAAAKTITAITAAAQAVVTSAAHGLAVGSFVTIESVVGMTEINGRIGLITAVTTDTFTLDINSSAFTAYSSGGVALPAEVLVDQRDGTLLSLQGSVGTINYTTGAFEINTSAPVVNTRSPYAEYYYEDSTDSDSGGSDVGAIADFSKTTPREAGEGFVLRQDDGGGPFQNLFSLGDDEYCMHTLKTWRVSLSADDLTATNKIYRALVGMEYFRAGCETGEGIIFADSADANEPFIRRLEINDISGLAVPVSLSDSLDLSDYRFDMGVVFRWGQYDVVACRHVNSAINDTCFILNRLWNAWDKLDYRISCLDILAGALIAGDSGSNNVFTLFSGLSDEESNIPNQWTSGNTTLDVEGTKKVHRMVLDGLIGPDQSFNVELSLDDGPFVVVQTISGSDDFVDSTDSILIGPTVLGREEIGGGGDGISAYHYRTEFLINTDRFERLRYRFTATGLGYLSVSELQFKDIRFKGRRVAQRYVEEGA